MKKINLDEEFVLKGWVYVFTEKNSSISLKRVRESKSKAEFTPPTVDEVKAYFKEKGYVEQAAIKFHEYYSAGNWSDSGGKPVKNWKQKALSVWFKQENKIQSTSTTMVR